MVTSANVKLNQFLNGCGGRYLIDTQMNFFRHFAAIFFIGSIGIGTHFLNAFVFIVDFQFITSDVSLPVGLIVL